MGPVRIKIQTGLLDGIRMALETRIIPWARLAKINKENKGLAGR
jgi:hypothetical protein